MDASTAMQEYLAATYRLAYCNPDNRHVSTSALAEEMGVSAPAVTRMIQRLEKAGYLDHKPYYGISLLPAGEREALACIRRRRLVERFLVDVMHFDWHEIYGMAGKLGAVISDAALSRMEEMTGFPKRCPHGEAIPTVGGDMPCVTDYPLNNAQPGNDYVLSRVPTHDEEILVYIAKMGLSPGVHFHLVDRAPFDGPLQVRVGDEIHHLGHALSGALRVCSREEFEQI